MNYINILIVFTYFFFTGQDTVCTSNDSVLNHLGTKTPYRFIANRDESPIIIEGCEPVKIWLLSRHGTRNPGKDTIRDMKKKLPIIRDEILKTTDNGLEKSDLENLRNWKPSVDKKDENILKPEGEDEMIQLAKRMKIRFPDVLPDIYSNSSYKFRHTANQRAEESARHFAVGLFGQEASSVVWFPPPIKIDPILKFYKLCDKWIKEVKNNPDTQKERQLFVQGPHMQKTLKNISTKLGLEYVNFDDALLMYMTCAFETAWHKTKISPWCAVFSNETIRTLEYSEDLKYYWLDGYAYKLTYQQACPVIKNLEEFFQRKDENQKAMLHFAHSGTVLKVLAHFGLYKDEKPLRHNNFIEQTQRQWRSSKIDVFGSNLASVLYRCGDSNKILLMHQERVVKIPGCSDDLCDFNEFLTIYKDSIYNCNFAEMCTV